MINFFRKLRRNLINEGNLKRYLFYALGEILLVVIGILVALQLNNWNQQRILRQKEKIILIQLREDLIINVDQFESNIAWEESRIDGIKLLNQFIENRTPWNDTLGVEVNWLRLVEELLISTSAFESLKSSGFDLISSEDLRKSIINLYDVIYHISVSRVDKYSTDFLGKRMKIYNRHFFRDWETTTTLLTSGDDIYDDQELQNMLAYRLFYKGYVIRFNIEGIDESHDVIAMIDEELERLK